ncbi:hypothetical protein Golob_026572 [Gossypium lobatum]|uniref:histidine kinase n=1 Tax=Gossypium lobatum TaxID=34289 RepID=A0A7J8LVJ8_9ROSI|nr:hypothetical protein [Gossypium lobatum]
MRALVMDPRPVRAKVSKYHIQRLGIHVEVFSDWKQGLSSISRANNAIHMVLIEQEVWDRDLKSSGLFMEKIGPGSPPKVFLLSNSINFSRGNTTPGAYGLTVISKPLRASMLAASLQRAMGIGNKGNPCTGELPSLSLRNLLLGRKILIVDDNNVNLKVAAGALKKYGADVVSATRGIKAIELLTPPHHFDACFMDIQMPEMDGFEATRRIRDVEQNINNHIKFGEISVDDYNNVSNWHVPILAMTADVIQATHEECLRCGMDGYVSKPFEAEQLYREGDICFCCRVYIESCLNIGIEFSCSFTIKMAKPVDPFVLICKVGHSNSKSFSAGLFANGNGGKKSNSNSWSVFIESCSNPRCVSNKNSCKIKAVFSEHCLLYHSDQIELKELKIACFSATEGEIAPL